MMSNIDTTPSSASAHGGGIRAAASSPARHLYNWKSENSEHSQWADYYERSDDRDGGGDHAIYTLIKENPIAIVKYSVGLVAAVLVIFLLVKIIDRERRKREIRGRVVLQMQSRRDGAIAELIQVQLDQQLAERKQRLLEEATTVVKDGDACGTDAVNLDALEAGTCAATTNISDNATLREDNSCAICLGEYETGDKVTSSLNAECKHHFHYDCIFDWLSRNNKNCPCCRLRFIPDECIIRDDKENPMKIVMPTDSTVDNALDASEEVSTQRTEDIDDASRHAVQNLFPDEHQQPQVSEDPMHNEDNLSTAATENAVSAPEDTFTQRSTTESVLTTSPNEQQHHCNEETKQEEDVPTTGTVSCSTADASEETNTPSTEDIAQITSEHVQIASSEE